MKLHVCNDNIKVNEVLYPLPFLNIIDYVLEKGRALMEQVNNGVENPSVNDAEGRPIIPQNTDDGEASIIFNIPPCYSDTEKHPNDEDMPANIKFNHTTRFYAYISTTGRIIIRFNSKDKRLDGCIEYTSSDPTNPDKLYDLVGIASTFLHKPNFDDKDKVSYVIKMQNGFVDNNTNAIKFKVITQTFNTPNDIPNKFAAQTKAKDGAAYLASVFHDIANTIANTANPISIGLVADPVEEELPTEDIPNPDDTTPVLN